MPYPYSDGDPYSFMYSNFWTRTRLCTQSWPNIGDSYGIAARIKWGQIYVAG